jgi:hypothetical protein
MTHTFLTEPDPLTGNNTAPVGTADAVSADSTASPSIAYDDDIAKDDVYNEPDPKGNTFFKINPLVNIHAVTHLL